MTVRVSELREASLGARAVGGRVARAGERVRGAPLVDELVEEAVLLEGVRVVVAAHEQHVAHSHPLQVAKVLNETAHLPLRPREARDDALELGLEASARRDADREAACRRGRHRRRPRRHRPASQQTAQWTELPELHGLHVREVGVVEALMTCPAAIILWRGAPSHDSPAGRARVSRLAASALASRGSRRHVAAPPVATRKASSTTSTGRGSVVWSPVTSPPSSPLTNGNSTRYRYRTGTHW